MSKLKPNEPALVQSFARGSVKPTVMQTLKTPEECLGDPCFGMCGSECTTPGGIASPECKGHDMCVCQFGHFACLTEVPPNCGGGTTGITCVALGAAAINWFQGIGNILSNLITDFFDFLSDFFDPDDPDCSNDPLEDCNNP